LKNLSDIFARFVSRGKLRQQARAKKEFTLDLKLILGVYQQQQVHGENSYSKFLEICLFICELQGEGVYNTLRMVQYYMA